MLSLQQTKMALNNLVDNWNPKYWLFAADGRLYLMRKNKDGKVVMIDDPHGGGVDQSYIIDSFNIDSDGGDW